MEKEGVKQRRRREKERRQAGKTEVERRKATKKPESWKQINITQEPEAEENLI